MSGPPTVPRPSFLNMEKNDRQQDLFGQTRGLAGSVRATADISPCGLYRYDLTRVWWDAPAFGIVTWIMLNPSKANAFDDDPTIRKCMGFAKTWGRGGIRVVNLFALRATDPCDLTRRVDDDPEPIGLENDGAIRAAIQEARGPVVAAWGAHRHPLLGDRVEAVMTWAQAYKRDLLCIGRTKSGAPKHPLMPTYQTPLADWFVGNP